jgi:hypothetical protein
MRGVWWKNATRARSREKKKRNFDRLMTLTTTTKKEN